MNIKDGFRGSNFVEIKSDRHKAEEFFKEAMSKWSRFLILWNEAMRDPYLFKRKEADDILIWFQTYYPKYKEWSNFEMHRTTPEGKTRRIDPLFDVLFAGGNFWNLRRNSSDYLDELNQVMPQLRAMASSLKDELELHKERLELPLEEALRIISRFHFAVSPLKNRRKGKMPFQLEDEYDVQDLLQAFLRLEFDDVRKEEPTPSYAGATSRIDIVLKNEKISIETKKTRKNLTEKEIGDQLINDIARYKNYPEINAVVFFVYDPDLLIENPDGLKSDLEKSSTEKLKVIVVVSPRGK